MEHPVVYTPWRAFDVQGDEGYLEWDLRLVFTAGGVCSWREWLEGIFLEW